MMRSSITNLKENLNKIALDVHDDDDEEFVVYTSRNRDDSTVSDRRISHTFAHSMSPSHSPFANGFDSALDSEIEHYKAEIKRVEESEAEIKALLNSYAALLKQKEDQISRLNEENGSLKHNLDKTNAALNTSRNESFKTSTNSQTVPKGSSDKSPNHQYKAIVKNRSIGSTAHNGVVSKQDGLSNGIGYVNIQGNEKELADLLEEKNISLAAMQATHELQIKQLGMELDKECGKLSSMQLKLQEEQKLNGSLQAELNSLKVDKNKSSMEMDKIRKELNKKTSEIRQLQKELNGRDNEEADDTVVGLKTVIATLEKENNDLKLEKGELEAALKATSSSSAHSVSPASETSNRHSNSLTEPSGDSCGKEEMELSLQKLEKDLKEAWRERDKALQELNRLKQHLLDKESEESEKMDEDSKIIEELRQNNEYQRAQILHLEKALKQATTDQEEITMMNNNELKKSKEIIDDLNRKLASCMSTIDAKNIELLNLQTALGQYYAEIEAKEHLEGDLAQAREESARLSEMLKDAYHQAEISKREKEETVAKLLQVEAIVADGKNRVNKLEEDNGKLHLALEQSITRLNRMSTDSDYFVDRRIVIKLLVTYFQRNHSKEVLDLMVRMLGFSDEDKQRIGIAQHGAGKGVVRGVLGLPGRLVGGILGGSSAEGSANVAPENQSFGDLWVDFLLKETEERERRGSAEANSISKGNLQGGSPNATGAASPMSDHRTTAAGASGFSRFNPHLNQNRSSLQPENYDSEFSTVPLSSSESNSRISRLLPRY